MKYLTCISFIAHILLGVCALIITYYHHASLFFSHGVNSRKALKAKHKKCENQCICVVYVGARERSAAENFIV